ncbi:MAG TPA: SDR family oxidoreductase [Hyphomicrobiaceae bacterium]|nr:SDR family oxidoreductase [Hyphomicrobiaceae bacterium]
MADQNLRPIALVTGAASGIGAATVRLIAGRCRGLVLHTRGAGDESRRRLEANAEAARAAGAEVVTLLGDLAQPGTGAQCVQAALAQFGRLDHVVANAGFADKRPLAELTRSDFDRSHATMAGALLEIGQAALPALRASPQGRVVFVSSFVAHRFVRGELYPASASAKAGAEALARAMAADLAHDGATVNIVTPGYTRKDGGHSALDPEAWKRVGARAPLGRVAEPEDVAHLIAFLLSPEARYITGQAIAVDGGLSLGAVP